MSKLIHMIYGESVSSKFAFIHIVTLCMPIEPSPLLELKVHLSTPALGVSPIETRNYFNHTSTFYVRQTE